MAAIQRGLCDRGVQVTGFCTILCGACLRSSGHQLDAAAEAAGWGAEGSSLMCCAAWAEQMNGVIHHFSPHQLSTGDLQLS